jgi:hypothetical protein
MNGASMLHSKKSLHGFLSYSCFMFLIQTTVFFRELSKSQYLVKEITIAYGRVRAILIGNITITGAFLMAFRD